MAELNDITDTITSAHAARTTLIFTTTAATETRSSARRQMRVLKRMRSGPQENEKQLLQQLLDTLEQTLRRRAKHARRA